MTLGAWQVIDLAKLITAQRDLQLKLNNNFTTMTTDDRITFIIENVLAATDELHEALGEVGWKSWASSQHLNDDAFFGELRDCWQFLTNLMLVVEPDPEKLALRFADALTSKLVINHARVGLYDGVTTKCPSCSRALEDVAIREVRTAEDCLLYICICGTSLNPDIVRTVLHD